MRFRELANVWREHLRVALLVGLVIGTLVGVAEGLYVLSSQELFGRYNELVAWAIVFDAPAVIVIEVGLAAASQVFSIVVFRIAAARRLVSLQLAESAFLAVLSAGAWSNGMANPSLFATQPLLGLVPPAIAGLVVGAAALIATARILDLVPALHKLGARHWLIAEALVLAAAVVFGFTH